MSWNILGKIIPRSKYGLRLYSKDVYTGKPDKISNIRPIIIEHKSSDTALETNLKDLQIKTQEWHHHYWLQHNLKYNKTREEFILNWFSNQKVPSNGSRKAIEPEDLAVFHRDFLHHNQKEHRRYDREWKQMNRRLLFLMAKVAVQRIYLKLVTPFFSKS